MAQVSQQPESPRVRRLPIVVSAVIAAVTVLLATLPSSLSSATQSYVSPRVEDAAATEIGRARQVAQFATNYRPELDPLVTLADGRQVKSSNYHGVLIDGVRYYYSLAPHYSLDPVGRGEIGWNQVVVKDRIPVSDDFTITVYTIPQ
jgi:hypothetical protein